MKAFFKRNSPPGIDLRQEWLMFLIGNVSAILVSFITFLDGYLDARNKLFTYDTGKRELIEDAVIAPFHSLFHGYFLSFFVVAIVLLCFIIYHYAYYRQDSMSIYLMKRLPDRRELHRRALTVPCLAALATIGVAIATIMLYYIIYVLATPKACLPYVALREIWR